MNAAARRTLRLPAAALWTALVAAWALAAPPADGDLWGLLEPLLTLSAPPDQAWLVAEFQLMGLWPLVLAALFADELRARPLPAWPFVLGSVFLGAFAFLPWLVLRGAEPRLASGRPERWLGHRLIGPLLAALALPWVGWALAVGSADAFLRVRAESQFVWVMTFDFCALWLTSVLGAWQSARTRGGPWPVALVPFAGTAIFLALRGPHAAPATESE